MDFSKDSIQNRLEDIRYGDTRNANRRAYIFRSLVVFVLLIVTCTAASFGFGVLTGIIENSPEVKELTFSPVGYASRTYDAKGNQVATLVQAGSNREEASYEEFPENLINAFVAIEDQRFWEHNGIDLRSISRAVRGVLTGNSSQGGGSTITQQLIKNNVFGGGNQKGFALYERKFQEWYIALSLENQPGKTKEEIKKEIITDYLNTINLGSNTLGVKVAARKYFGKELKDLDLAECTVLASITKNPSRLNPLTHPEENQERRLQVLKNMVSQGYITETQQKAASGTVVYDEIQEVNLERSETSSEVYSFFTDELISQCLAAFKKELGMTEAEAKNLLYSGGLEIYTTQDPDLQKIVDEEINNPENYETQEYSIKWRLSIITKDGKAENYSEKNVEAWLKEQDTGFNGLFATKEEAAEAVEGYRKTIIGKALSVTGETLDYTLEPQASFVLIDHHTGEVKAISGGRGEKEYSLTTNRATGTYRQPGSAFKVLTSFAPAMELKGATLGTTYYDAKYQIAEKEFRNWWNHSQYFGFSSIREGIEFSMNIIAVRCLLETVSPEEGVDFAQRLGITTLQEEDKTGALALGGITKGVTNLELTNAYAAIADGGLYHEYRFFTKIYDHDGNLLIDHSESTENRVMKETTAWLLTDALRMSTVAHTKYASDYTVNNTSSKAHLENMICAGKSGTTTNNRDVWFVGFTPYYTAGVWGGCDDNQSLSDSSTGEYHGGTSFHKILWNKIMTRVHETLENPGSFQQPGGIVTAEICRKSGQLATDLCRQDVRGGQSGTYTEYFDQDNVPTAVCSLHQEDGTLLISEEELARGFTDDTVVNGQRQEAAAQAAAEAETYAPEETDESIQILGPGAVSVQRNQSAGNTGPVTGPGENSQAAGNYDR